MRNILVLFTCLLGALSSAIAQEKAPLTFSFEQDSILAEPGITFINFLLVKNQSSDSLKINKITAQAAYPGSLLSPSTASFSLAPNESKRFPVKFLTNQDFLKIPEQSIQYNISYLLNGDNKTQSASFHINRKEEIDLNIYPFALDNYLDPNLPENKVSFFVENRSYSSRQIKLSYRLQPDGLQIAQKELIINLESKEKRLIELQVSSRSTNAFSPDYQLIVNAEDLILNKVVGSTAIRIVILSSSRQMNATRFNTTGNSIELTHNQLNKGLSYSQLRANGTFLLNKLQASFTTNADYYQQRENLNIYNTWFELGNQKLTLRLGNIYGDGYDYSISGNGAKITYQPNDHRSFEIIGSQNDYSIYNNLNNNNRNLATTLASRYQFTNKNTQSEIAYIYNTDPEKAINTNLLTLSSSIKLDPIQNIRFEGGISNEQNTDAMIQAFGYSAGIYYGIKDKNWSINSTNFYSTPEYAGQKRGTLNLNQSVSYSLSTNKQLFLRYSNNTNQPHYLTQIPLVDLNGMPLSENYYYGRNQTLGTGISLNHNNFNFSISPQIIEQKNITNRIENKMLSYNIRADISTGFGKHNLSLSSEYGLSNVNNEDDWSKTMRLMLSYRYKNISLNAIANLNPQNIYDAIQAIQSKNKSNNYSLYSSYSFKAFNQKLIANLSGGLNYSAIYSNFNKSLNANVEYTVMNNWALTAASSYSGFKSENFSSNNMQFRAGIKKYFKQATALGNHKVKLKLFQDKNYNGIMDNQEQAIPGKIIRLNSTAALTDKNGEVSYQNVMSGTYRIRIDEKEGLQLGSDSLQVKRNKTVLLPMIQNNHISGELKEIRQQYDEKISDIVGVNIYARNEKGEIFNTFVNPEGKFNFYVKEGTYTIYIENNRYQFLNPSQNIKVITGQDSDKLIFEFKKKDTEIKVKKF
ncbi:porin family protein [Albibacterium bauzanense]|uniref:SdrD B-like protein n=1 Tax=Albibacterium bauzanense TaxID=653929 RepID=A0A4R1LZU8_9SPHI|nr:hypothetical protein [Albibacterium bauzanense]TCK85128.1 SdrD B-like protein [Albibacterium bauzanense]